MGALLGALSAQLDLGCAAIGGKDSMSGSFDDLDVPPTLVSFAVTTDKCQHRLPRVQGAGHKVVWLCPSTAPTVCRWLDPQSRSIRP